MEIEKGIPITPMKAGRGRKMVYPFEGMEVGDSFAVDISKKVSVQSSAMAWAKRKKNGFKFSVREEEGKIRIWRVA